uniref:Secreted protein n=1 Tax=Ixodes ricinus TaxID=34613 RepID=A0A6B0V1W9_IXORI
MILRFFDLVGGFGFVVSPVSCIDVSDELPSCPLCWDSRTDADDAKSPALCLGALTPRGRSAFRFLGSRGASRSGGSAAAFADRSAEDREFSVVPLLTSPAMLEAPVFGSPLRTRGVETQSAVSCFSVRERVFRHCTQTHELVRCKDSLERFPQALCIPCDPHVLQVITSQSALSSSDASLPMGQRHRSASHLWYR